MIPEGTPLAGLTVAKRDIAKAWKEVLARLLRYGPKIHVWVWNAPYARRETVPRNITRYGRGGPKLGVYIWNLAQAPHGLTTVWEADK